MTQEDDRKRFPAARSLKVDDLLIIYDGIIPDADDVLKESQIAGSLPLPNIPSGLDGYVRWSDHNDPLPPDDLTEVSDLIIGKLFSFFQNWANYVSAETTRARAIRDVQSRHLNVVKSGLSIYYKEEMKKPASMVGDWVNVDERFVRVDAALMKVKVFYETANDRYEQLKRVLNNVSREQTRRKDELERLIHDEGGGRPHGDGNGRGGGGFPGRRPPRSFRE